MDKKHDSDEVPRHSDEVYSPSSELSSPSDKSLSPGKVEDEGSDGPLELKDSPGPPDSSFRSDGDDKSDHPPLGIQRPLTTKSSSDEESAAPGMADWSAVPPRSGPARDTPTLVFTDEVEKRNRRDEMRAKRMSRRVASVSRWLQAQEEARTHTTPSSLSSHEEEKTIADSTFEAKRGLLVRGAEIEYINGTYWQDGRATRNKRPLFSKNDSLLFIFYADNTWCIGTLAGPSIYRQRHQHHSTHDDVKATKSSTSVFRLKIELPKSPVGEYVKVADPTNQAAHVEMCDFQEVHHNGSNAAGLVAYGAPLQRTESLAHTFSSPNITSLGISVALSRSMWPLGGTGAAHLSVVDPDGQETFLEGFENGTFVKICARKRHARMNFCSESVFMAPVRQDGGLSNASARTTKPIRFVVRHNSGTGRILILTQQVLRGRVTENVIRQSNFPGSWRELCVCYDGLGTPHLYAQNSQGVVRLDRIDIWKNRRTFTRSQPAPPLLAMMTRVSYFQEGSFASTRPVLLPRLSTDDCVAAELRGDARKIAAEYEAMQGRQGRLSTSAFGAHIKWLRRRIQRAESTRKRLGLIQIHRGWDGQGWTSDILCMWSLLRKSRSSITTSSSPESLSFASALQWKSAHRICQAVVYYISGIPHIAVLSARARDGGARNGIFETLGVSCDKLQLLYCERWEHARDHLFTYYVNSTPMLLAYDPDRGIASISRMNRNGSRTQLAVYKWRPRLRIIITQGTDGFWNACERENGHAASVAAKTRPTRSLRPKRVFRSCDIFLQHQSHTKNARSGHCDSGALARVAALAVHPEVAEAI